MRIVGNAPSGGKKPTTPTIGTATDGGTGTTVSVAFTPSTYIGKSTITYTATSSPGSLTGTGSSSPITVSGLTTGTAYTFTVAGNTAYGVASDASSASNSVTPAVPSSFESIATVTASGGETSLSFTSIPSTYKHLQIRGRGIAGQPNPLQINFNSVTTGSQYAWHNITGTGSTAGTDNGSSVNVITVHGAVNAGASLVGGSIIDIHDYASTSKYKTTRAISGNDANGAAGRVIALSSGLWMSTSAITSIQLSIISTSFSSGTTFALYGIKGA